MKHLLTVVALSLSAACLTVALPLGDRESSSSSEIIDCFSNLLATAEWPERCQAAATLESGQGFIKSISYNQLTLDLTTKDPLAPTFSSKDQVLDLRSLSDGADNGTPIGVIETPWSPVTVTGSSSVSTTFKDSIMKVYSDAQEAFGTLTAALVSQGSHSLDLEGTIDLQFNLGPKKGQKQIFGIRVDVPTTIEGLNNLGGQIQFNRLVKADSSIKDTVTLESVLAIENAPSSSQLTLVLGDVSLSVSTPNEDNYAGRTFIKNLALGGSAKSEFQATTYLDYAIEGGAKVVNDLSSQDVTVDLSGFPIKDTGLNAALAALSIKLVIPSISGLPSVTKQA
ncbi:hypothetical protein BGZ83_008307 [Gryganskiella cystojenkinii]|nr:hypothetical protein BGZ83_008307 [Gryganskiella cystojenkinii]